MELRSLLKRLIIRMVVIVKSVENIMSMQNQINQTDHLSAANVGWVGDLESEVNDSVSKMMPEIIFRLIEKRELENFQQIFITGNSVDLLRKHYVLLKITSRKLMRLYEKYLGTSYEIQWHEVAELIDKTKNARKEYYVAKRRHENKCSSDCTCRGCRCIKDLPYSGS
jgi:hypothetical protein